jgi:hypothetical protein
MNSPSRVTGHHQRDALDPEAAGTRQHTLVHPPPEVRPKRSALHWPQDRPRRVW